MGNRLTLVLVVSVLALAAACHSSPPDSENVLAPDFRLALYQGQDQAGGDDLRLSQLRGKPVVLNFWAAFCPPCRAELPELQQAYQDYQTRVQFLGVDLGQFTNQGSPEDARALLRELEVTYPAGYPESNLVPQYQILGLPRTVFITDQGEVFRRWDGPITGAKLAEIADQLLEPGSGN